MMSLEMGDVRESHMLREILEQSATLRACIDTFGAGAGGRLLDEATERLFSRRRLVIAATGSSRHAGLVAASAFRETWDVDVLVTTSGEFPCLPRALQETSSLLLISQSGETTDTVDAMVAGKRLGCPTVALTNAAVSALALGADVALTLPVGRELAVPATKSFTGQTMVMLLMAVRSQMRSSRAGAASLLDEIYAVPEMMARCSEQWLHGARRLADECSVGSMYFLGHGMDGALALEGALKLKETAYLHAEGMSSTEVEHGPKALIEDGMPVMLIEPSSLSPNGFDAGLGGRLEALGANVIRLTEAEGADCITVEPSHPYVSCLQKAVPLQMFAYCMAKRLGREIDAPRHLAKAVTLTRAN